MTIRYKKEFEEHIVEADYAEVENFDTARIDKNKGVFKDEGKDEKTIMVDR